MKICLNHHGRNDDKGVWGFLGQMQRCKGLLKNFRNESIALCTAPPERCKQSGMALFWMWKWCIAGSGNLKGTSHISDASKKVHHKDKMIMPYLFYRIARDWILAESMS
jgi:hypothetical protein